ncbi:NrsF family protein [Thioclava sp. F28-4]|uniref:NrsF family protein n=1 Tax=Thioclava sp. F28-4 TaxID=1915315 RepID=UPI000997135A|nr:DUF1109 domain-containing protein [Thioclava sp. F28-4]OOY03622.1 hypothetical protein BMI87_16515 [Thioclava sp. F28-4]
MKTEDLISVLQQDTLPDPRPKQVLGRWLVPALLLSALFVISVYGLRFPLQQTLMTPEIAPKFYLPLVLAVLVTPMAVRLGRPTAKVSTGWLWIFPAIGAALLAYAFLTTPEGQRMSDFEGETILPCLISVPMLSLPALGALLISLRKGAVTRPAQAGALAGLAAGGMGTAIYALHCTEDSPLFYVTWYGAGIVVVMLAGALLGKRVLRW